MKTDHVRLNLTAAIAALTPVLNSIHNIKGLNSEDARRLELAYQALRYLKDRVTPDRALDDPDWLLPAQD